MVMKRSFLALLCTVGLCACSTFPNSKTLPDAVLTAEMAFCIDQHSSDGVMQIMVECNIPQTLMQDVVDAQAKSLAHKAAAKHAGK
jgi:hypothetical protein